MVMTKKTAEIALNIFIGDSLKQVIKSGAKLGTQFIFPVFFRGLIPYRLIQIILYFLEKKKGTEYHVPLENGVGPADHICYQQVTERPEKS